MSFELLIPAAIGASVLMGLLWLVERRTNDATSVDVGWTTILVGLAVFYATAAPGAVSRRLLVAGLVSTWGVRLIAHLLPRVFEGAGEDARYREIRAQWGDRAHRNFFLFYQAQGVLAVVLSIPFLIAASDPSPELGLIEASAVLVTLVALAFETLADRQLHRFRLEANHRGKTCRAGLWKYSRHPNYFFEWLVWCGFGLLALPSPGGLFAIGSPLILLYLITRVTGIPPSEEQALRRRGDDYREYQRTTSAFVPWFPKENSEWA